jgi:hypothetical protein
MERRSILLKPVHRVGVETALKRNTNLRAIAALVDIHNVQLHSVFYGCFTVSSSLLVDIIMAICMRETYLILCIADVSERQAATTSIHNLY